MIVMHECKRLRIHLLLNQNKYNRTTPTNKATITALRSTDDIATNITFARTKQGLSIILDRTYHVHLF